MNIFEQIREERSALNTYVLVEAFEKGLATVRDRFDLATAEGRGFRASTEFQLSKADAPETIYFENPVNSGKDVLISEILISTDSVVEITTDRNPTKDTAGTAVQVNNRLIPATQSEEVDAQSDVEIGTEYSGGYGSLDTRTFGRTTGPSVTPGTDTASYNLAEGASFGIQIDSQADGNDIVVTILFEEKSV